MSDSFFWYDLETTGVNPRWDRVTQFAGLRTDLALRETGEEYQTYVQLAPDVLPSPGSVRVTGITPQVVARQGVTEWEAFRRILELFSKPGTCVAGYNSLRFDDEFMRYGLYRMLLDPYAREWQNGNSRWDLIDLVRAAYALRPEGIEWPVIDGVPVFKLEELSAANGIAHESAHDAMSDVRATVGLARIIREHQPLLFQYYFKGRTKRQPRDLLEPIGRNLCVHVTGMYPRDRRCLAPIVSAARHPRNSNSYIVVDLSQDIRPLLEWSIEKIQEALFTPDVDERPPLKEVRINRCPFISGANVLRTQDQTRLNLRMNKIEDRKRRLAKANISRKIAEVYKRPPLAGSDDVDAALYQGFYNEEDKQRCVDFQDSLDRGVWPEALRFDDARLPELVFRLKARSFPHLLTDEEGGRWLEFVRTKLAAQGAEWLTLDQARQELQELAPPGGAGEPDANLLALDEHYATLAGELGVAG
ncbi:MAG: exodeoxyribonuclease I [Pseudomonadota bacterium]